MKIRFLVLFSVFLFSSLAQADIDSVEATIDKNPVMVDEAIQLTVTAHGDPERDAFDSSPLLKDFVVGRTSVSTQTRIINMDKEQTTSWITTLFPRGEGTFTIPALTVEGKQTKPINVKVIPVQKGGDEQARDYYVSTSVDTSEVYLHQQLLYTVKLYISTNIERGSLQAPTLKDAQIQQLGDDKQYSDIVNGKRYQVIERNFAIVPQSSGEFTIKGPVFTGEVLTQDPNARFGFFNQTKQINRLGPDVTVNVKPVPADIDYHWLPSEYVTINDEWPQNTKFTVGEPVTRTITLAAMGVVKEQLPEFPQMYPPGFKLYPDQANTTTVNKNNTLIAQRVESLAMIPTQAGKFVLPEISIPWFNVLTGKTEYAKLPARSIDVAPATVGTPSTPPAQQPITTDSPAAPVETNPSPAAPPQQATPQLSNTYTLVFIGLWLLTLAGWAGTIVHYRRKGTTSTPAKAHIASTASTESARFGVLTNTIKNGSPGQVQHALSSWVAAVYPAAGNYRRLEQFPALAFLQPQIDAMLSSQYSHEKQQWDKNALLQGITEARQKLLSSQQSGSMLRGLYQEDTSS